MENDLEIAVDKAIYEVYAERQPSLVASVATTVAAGQSPEQVETEILLRTGSLSIARHVRHIAEHLVRTQ